MNTKKIITSKNDILVAIDIGTTKISVLIAHYSAYNQCEIIGIGKAPSYGLEKGVIVDVARATQAIKAAVQEAELMSGITIETAYIGISGAHIRAHNSHGMVPIKSGEIRESDIARVIAVAQAIPLPEGEKILHVMPQLFTIDGNQVVRDPLKMHGVRLEAQVHIITGGITSVQNLVKCCESAGIHVRDIVLEPIASAQAVLSKDEQELGVAMLDIGGGTSDFAVYQRGSIRHTNIIPIAGNLFTHDIALCLRTTRNDAERVKKDYATLLLSDNFHENIVIQCTDGEATQQIAISDLNAIVRYRAEELILLVHHEIMLYKLAQFMPSGLVITGGGSLLSGIIEYAGTLLDTPVRAGKPKLLTNFHEELDNPIYATGYGLLLYAINQEKNSHFSKFSGPLITRVFWKMKSWVADFF